MAEHTLSILVKAIGAAKASKDLKGVDATVSRIGSHAGQGIRTAAGNVAKLGLLAGAGIGLAVKTGLDDLATLESAVTSVDGSIKQVGLTGKVTGAQVAGWANEIEAAVGAAFDDKDIVSATSTLIRYGKVSQSNLRPAMEVMTDLAAKTGSVESASTLLSKALADPTKAAGKLARTGVILTKQQQKQIKTMVDAGDTAGAQALLLDALATSTKGAAAASQGPYKRAISTLSDVSEDARKALAEGFLPVIEKVAGLLSKGLANPKTMQSIRDFGKGLAGSLDSVIEVAKGLPWTQIGDSLRIAGAGGKAVLEAFTKMPPWVQTAILTGWGLNKLTGGAVGGIAGELGKGLIKGVLGMNAGVVNIKAGVVNGGGGVPGAGGAGGGSSPLALLGAAGIATAIIAASVPIGEAFAAALPASLKGEGGAGKSESQTRIENARSQKPTVIVRDNKVSDPRDARPITERLEASNKRLETIKADAGRHHASDLLALRANRDATNKTSLEVQRKGERTIAATARTESAARNAGQATSAAMARAAAVITAAIRANRPVVNVSSTTVNRTTTVNKRYGPQSASRNGREYY